MIKVKRIIKKLFRKTGNLFTADLKYNLERFKKEVGDILIDNYLQRNVFNNPQYLDPKKLTRYEYQVYSQHGEDGIIEEIFKRIGITNKFFVEFGVEKGLECNTLFLLVQGWSGCWIDGEEEYIKAITENFLFLIKKKQLFIERAFITAENIELLFNSLSVPKEFDLLSIDIDRNDYWILDAIKSYSPRVIIIEYNAMFKPPTEFIVKYEPEQIWKGTSHFGASLKSFEKLGLQKGYKLVGCDYTGVNAFFIREDLVNDDFLGPFTAENHYEPPRYFLTRKIGYERDFGDFTTN
jgi:hypothetical protein